MTAAPDRAQIAVEKWLTGVVVKHNFCPFAGPALNKNKVRFVTCKETSEAQILTSLESELSELANTPNIETSLVILDGALADFTEYNQFLDLAEALVFELGYEGVFQLASFHPDYCFADVSDSDPTNYTNRSPYPLLHILRESSIEWAVDDHPNVDLIPERNINYLNDASPSELAIIRSLSSVPSTPEASGE